MKYYANPEKQELRMLQDEAPEPGNGFHRIAEHTYRMLETLTRLGDILERKAGKGEDDLEAQAKAHGFSVKGVREQNSMRCRSIAKDDMPPERVAEGEARYDKFSKESVSIPVSTALELLTFLYATDAEVRPMRGVLYRALEAQAMKHQMQIMEHEGGIMIAVGER